MADSATLPPLSQLPNPGLVGFVAVYTLPQADLLQEPVVAGGQVVGDLLLAEGAGWRPLPYTPHTLKFDEQPKPDRGGTTYQVRVTAQRPQPDADILAALAALDRRKLLLLLVEVGGRRRLIGSAEEYVQLLTSSEGQSPAARAGVELRLEGQTTRRAPYYAGVVPVLGGGSSLAAPGTLVRVVDKKGRLMAEVAPGTTITIASGFRVALTFS